MHFPTEIVGVSHPYEYKTGKQQNTQQFQLRVKFDKSNTELKYSSQGRFISEKLILELTMYQPLNCLSHKFSRSQLILLLSIL